MSNNNNSRRRKATKLEKTIAGAVILGTAVGVPLTFIGSASAATMPQWNAIAQCESGGNWSINYSSDGMSVGGLQFQAASWTSALAYLDSKGYNTSGWTHNLYQGMPSSQVPTKDQTILGGEALIHLQGRSAWVCDTTQGGVLSASMFDGGPNPWGLSGTNVPANLGGTGAGSTPTSPAAPDLKPVAQTGHHPAAPVGQHFVNYKVVKGDTLNKIAKSFGLTTDKLAQFNPDTVTNINKIAVGQLLRHPVKDAASTTPSGKTYTVITGDNLYSIALANKVGDGGSNTWKPLYDANKAIIGDNPDLILPGQKLVIPGSSAPAAPATPAPVTPKPAPTKEVASGWNNPLVHMDVIQSFHNPGAYQLGYHTGVDLSVGGKTGVAAKAITQGKIVFAGMGGAGAAYGNHVILQLPDGKYALYAHLNSVAVQKGQTVGAGQMVGIVGTTGNSSGIHLHFEIRNDATAYAEGVFQDPISYLATRGL